ncbi:hypothetical protein AB5I41_28010 [Sphingomonas sp. MMS24-JH45]
MKTAAGEALGTQASAYGGAGEGLNRSTAALPAAPAVPPPRR